MTKLERLLSMERARMICGGCRQEYCVACESYWLVLTALENLLPEAIDAAMGDRSEQ